MSTVEDHYRRVAEEKRRSGGGLAGAVRGACIECVYDPLANGTAAEQIYECMAAKCPLYPHRRGKQTSKKIPDPEMVTLPKMYSNEHGRYISLIRQNQEKGTLRAAVDAYCIECIYDAHEPGTWRQQVENCDRRDCPLWSKRATSKKVAA